MQSVERTVREFIAKNFVMGRNLDALGADDSLMEAGIVDSTGVLELTAFLEGTFDVQIGDEELLPENLDTVGCIVRFIERKKGVAA